MVGTRAVYLPGDQAITRTGMGRVRCGVSRRRFKAAVAAAAVAEDDTGGICLAVRLVDYDFYRTQLGVRIAMMVLRRVE